MMQKNIDIKKYMKFCGVAQWRVAEALGVHEMTLSRWLRYDMTEEKRKTIFDVIDRLAAEDLAQANAESEV